MQILIGAKLCAGDVMALTYCMVNMCMLMLNRNNPRVQKGCALLFGVGTVAAIVWIVCGFVLRVWYGAA